MLIDKLKRKPPFFFFAKVWIVFRSVNFFRSLKDVLRYVLKSNETHSFTYALTEINEKYLCHTISIVTKESLATVKKYFDELKNDTELKKYLKEKIMLSEQKDKLDQRYEFTSRLAWYAIIRIIKPNVVVENGVSLGISALLMCRALQKNRIEGQPGKYIGIDIDPQAGFLVNDDFFGQEANILIGDALSVLKNFKESVDFYFSDGLRYFDYEKEEFNLLQPYLNAKSIIVSNKLYFSSALADFSEKNGRNLIYFKESPKHWYSGAGIGISY
jgi:predicted O-methyltransferase YrrM